MQEDRRCIGSLRFPVRIPALVEPLAAEGPLIAGFVTNLSCRGLLLLARQAVAGGSLLRLTLQFRSRVPFTLTGAVEWVRPGGNAGCDLGIQFGQALADNLVAAIAEEESAPALTRRATAAIVCTLPAAVDHSGSDDGSRLEHSTAGGRND